jgi:serine/threonine protein kinase
MAREITLLCRLGDNPYVARLNDLITSRLNMATSIYLILEYMEHDLFGFRYGPCPYMSPCMKI